MTYPTGARNGFRTSPIGAKRKARVQWEAAQARALEGTETRLGLFQLHHVDFLHNETPQRDKGTLKEGHPDYLLIGEGWSAYLEIKARNVETRVMGKLSAGQRAFHERLKQAGQEVWTAYLPDDMDAINQWLFKKTGIVVVLT